MVEVSVIIVNYNTFDLTSRCLESIFNKTQDILFEVIVVDNASTDRDPLLFKSNYPSISLITSKQNVGFSRGNNLGIREAKGKFILLLNSDTVLLNDAISEAVSYLRSHAEVGVVSAQLVYEDGIVQPVTGRFPSIKRELFDLFRFSKFLNVAQRQHYYLGTEADYTLPIKADWVWGAFFMFRASDLRHFPNQLLHEDFFMYYEDVQWCYHFKTLINKEVHYIPSARAIHYMGKSDPSLMDYDKKYSEKILPNEKRWMQMVKGKMYTSLYYLIKAIHYLSLRNARDRSMGKVFLNMAKT